MNKTLDAQIRGDFPILQTEMEGHPLVFLDNGATTQKPQAVIDAISNYYARDNANIHRGAYELSQRATDGFEAARGKVAQLLGAEDPAECIFVRGTTEAINLVAMSWGSVNLQPGDEVLLSGLEHHSNIVPWQFACDRAGAEIRVLHNTPDGELDLREMEEMLSERTKMVAIQHVSNALGNVHSVARIVELAKRVGATVLIDGAQWVAHAPTNVREIGCDFYTFSGHKLFGPTGIGVLWGRRELLESIPPYQGGGDMIESVAFSKTTFAPLPNRYEAGTPNIAGAIGLGAAIDYLRNIGFERIAEHEHDLLDYAVDALQGVAGLRIVGNPRHRMSAISFVLEEPAIAQLDIATWLSRRGIAIRTGHHCCMPLMDALGVPGTSRASLAMYNSRSDIDALVAALTELVEDRVGKQAARQAESSPDADDQTVEIEFGAAAGASIADVADDLAEEFLLFDDRESKTEMLMEMGQELPDDFERLKQLSTPVPGCMSEVYLVGRPNPEQPLVFEFAADSNAEIVRGLIAILRKLFSGQSAEAVLEFDIQDFFRRIGLDQFISTQRRSGLDGMLKRVRLLAKAIVDREASVADPGAS